MKICSSNNEADVADPTTSNGKFQYKLKKKAMNYFNFKLKTTDRTNRIFDFFMLSQSKIQPSNKTFFMNIFD